MKSVPDPNFPDCAHCPRGMDGRPITVIASQPFQWAHQECLRRAQDMQRRAKDNDEGDEGKSPEVTEDAVPANESVDDPDDFVPAGGFAAEQFPIVVVELRPYVTRTQPRADPIFSVGENGALAVEAGQVRIAFPTRVEWEKFCDMGRRLHNSQERASREKARTDDVSSADTA